MKTRIIIDCDPGLDDAVALLAAFGAPSLDVLAITTVAGNVKAPQTAINARIIRELAGVGREVPVHAGAPRPLLRDAITAEDFHGTTGLGGIDFPKPTAALSRTHAVNALVSLCRQAKSDPLTLVITGPMTNVALALTMAPDIAEGLSEIVLMGGADSAGGNITPTAEFNVFADPHAAAIVFGFGIPIRCFSLDVTHQLRTTPKRLRAIEVIDTPQAKAAAALLDASNKLEFSANKSRSAPLHDPSTILALVKPDLFSGDACSVGVVTETGYRFGQTVVAKHTEGHVIWMDSVDADAAFDVLADLLGGPS